MSKWLTVFIGCVANVVILSLPLVVAPVSYQALFFSPCVWLFYLLTSAFCFFESIVSFSFKKNEPENPQQAYHPYVAGATVLIIFWLSLLEYSQALSLFYTSSMLGVFLTSMGIFLRVKAINTLRQYFLNHIGVLHNHQLITHGIYATIRHPSEMGLLCICLGIAILMNSWIGGILTLAVLCPLSIYRTRVEDKAMQQKFGNAFIKYRHGVGRLLPLWF